MVISNITVLDSVFTNFKSSLSGSFLIVESDTDSNANLTIMRSTFTCSSLSIWDNYVIEVLSKLQTG